MGTWEYDFATGKVLMSPRALELLGTSEDAFDPALWHALGYVHPGDRERVQAAATPAPGAAVFELTIEHRTRWPEHEERWVRSHSTIYRDDAGQPQRLIGTLVDITEQKRHEDALKEARDRAEEMVRLRDAFLANMSHEIRTPLTTLLGYIELLRLEVPPSLHEFVEGAEQGGQRLLHLLTSLLELSQLQAGLVQRTPRRVPLRRVLEGALLGQRPRARAKGLALHLDVDPALRTAWLDPVLVERLLGLLLDNAVKFTDAGEVRLRASGEGDTLVLSVEDTGPGMPAGVVAQAFEPFRQGSEGFARTHEGTGLGLTLARYLAEVLGALCEMESAPGVGTVCRLRLPGALPSD
jgi:signal transduction histidine kinase